LPPTASSIVRKKRSETDINPYADLRRLLEGHQNEQHPRTPAAQQKPPPHHFSSAEAAEGSVKPMRAGRKRTANDAGICRSQHERTAKRPTIVKKHEGAIRDTKSLKELARPYLLAVAKMPLESLTTKWSVGTNRRIKRSHVRELCNAFRINGLQRREPGNHLLLLCSADQVYRAREAHGVSTEKEEEDLMRWSEVNEGSAEVMAGQHRIEALREFAREVGSGQEPLWWTCELYDRGRPYLPRPRQTIGHPMTGHV
jgi:hypothetical protein